MPGTMSPPGLRIAELRSSIDKTLSGRPAVIRPFKNGVYPVVVLLAVAPFFVCAAPEVVDSRAATSTTSSVSYRPPIEEVDQNTPMENQYQMQLLQQEVMELRGLLEEIRYELDRIKTTQDDRYLELDARLQQVVKAAAEPPPSKIVMPDVMPGDGAPLLDEKTSYDTALQLIRNRQYELAITQLESVIARFPDGDYAANSYYWLGEVYAAKPTPDYEKARQALAQVITFFPDHRKVPDAAFKLGKVYHLLGDCSRATELLTQVIEQNDGKSVAKLADTYLRESVNCDS